MEKFYILYLELPPEIQHYILSYNDPDVYKKKLKVLEEFLDIVDDHNNCNRSCNCSNNFVRFILNYNAGYLYDKCKSLSCYSIHDEIICIKIRSDNNNNKFFDFKTIN